MDIINHLEGFPIFFVIMFGIIIVTVAYPIISGRRVSLTQIVPMLVIAAVGLSVFGQVVGILSDTINEETSLSDMEDNLVLHQTFDGGGSINNNSQTINTPPTTNNIETNIKLWGIRL